MRAVCVARVCERQRSDHAAVKKAEFRILRHTHIAQKHAHERPAQADDNNISAQRAARSPHAAPNTPTHTTTTTAATNLGRRREQAAARAEREVPHLVAVPRQHGGALRRQVFDARLIVLFFGFFKGKGGGKRVEGRRKQQRHKTTPKKNHKQTTTNTHTTWNSERRASGALW